MQGLERGYGYVHFDESGYKNAAAAVAHVAENPWWGPVRFDCEFSRRTSLAWRS